MLTNIDQGGLRERNMDNIHNPLTAVPCWDKLCSDFWKKSSNYTILHLAVWTASCAKV